MRRMFLALFLLALTPGPARAHDAFGDLGPFYASLLHPLADPMQAVLLIGTAAFFAGRSLRTVRVALPVFVATAAAGHILLAWHLGIVPHALLPATVAIAVGGTAMLPDRWTRPAASLTLVIATGVLAGLAPDHPTQDGALQQILGTLLGITLITALTWTALDAAARHVSTLAPAVAGSWVAAVGLLAGAFAMLPADAGASRLGATFETSALEKSDQ